MTTINIAQGDTAYKNFQLKEAGQPIDLTGYIVKFAMIDKDSGEQYEIDCLEGFTEQIGIDIIPYSQGGISIPFLPSITNNPGKYTGQIRIYGATPSKHKYFGNMFSEYYFGGMFTYTVYYGDSTQSTFPVGSYIDVIIWWKV
jgi:hypothetical protein